MLKKITLTLFIAALALVAQAAAQTEIKPEKQAAIKELIALINVDNKAEEMVEMFDKQMSGTRVAIINSILDERTDLSEAERKTLRDSISVRSEEYARRFRERLMQKLNYNEMIDEISMLIYDKYFTLEEIKDLVAFYKTPTGQKTLRTMTPLMTDTMRMMSERLLPKIPVVLDELQKEEKAEIEREVNARKPRAKKPVSK
jgi:uncharacterized protein